MTRKVQRILDGLVYAVHDERPHDLFYLTGVDTGVRDYLVNSPDDNTRIWLDGYDDVLLITRGDPPVDVP